MVTSCIQNTDVLFSTCSEKHVTFDQSFKHGTFDQTFFQNMLPLINTKKAFKKLYMFYFETFRIILTPSSVNGLRIIRNVSK